MLKYPYFESFFGNNNTIPGTNWIPLVFRAQENKELWGWNWQKK